MLFIRALALAFSQLRHPKMIKLILVIIGCSFAMLTLFIATVNTILEHTTLLGWGWLDSVLDWIGTGIASIMAWFLFPLLIPLIGSAFISPLARIVEASHYPNTAIIAQQSLVKSIRYDLIFIVKAIGINLICLPIYLIPVVNIVFYYSLNSFLIGREFFDVIIRRYLPLNESRHFRHKHLLQACYAGGFILIISTLPMINLVAPVIGVALTVHMVNRLLAKTNS